MLRSTEKWLPGYLQSVFRRPRTVSGPKHLMFCLADHFEPLGNALSRNDAVRLVREWIERYPDAAKGCRDSDGIPPRHTFFYPAEEYDAQCLDLLAGLCVEGLCEVEVQLHHRNDTADGLCSKLSDFRHLLHDKHGLLGWDSDKKPRYGFIHGNWALCNSRPDGDWCGVNEELTVLNDTGCYADFTFPSAPSPTQPRMVNAIYRARDGAGRPRGADRGELVRAGESNPRAPALPHADTPVLLIQGPLALDWKRRKWGVLPRLENGDITAVNPPLPRRIDLWVKQGIHVIGRPDWIFVKVYTHGCAPGNREGLLGGAMRAAREHLARAYNDGAVWRLHYVSAREMFNIARAAEDGMQGDPGDYRDYEIGKPRCVEFDRPQAED